MKKVSVRPPRGFPRDFLANNPQLDGAVWTKEKAVAFALKAYQETRFKELGGRTAQEAATSNKFVMSVGKHGTIDPKALRTEAFASLSRNTTSTWIDSDGKEQTRRSVYAFKYPKGKEKRWGPKAAEAGMETRPFLTMTEAEAIGFKHITLAVFPNSLNALEGEYAVQVKAKDDLMDSEFSGGVRGHTHMPAMFFRAPVPVDVKHEMKKLEKQQADGMVSPATVFILYAEVGDETAQAWANGGAPDHIFIEESNMRLDLNEC